MSKAIEKFSWLTPIAIVLWYCLYGWGLSAISSPFLAWLIAAGVAAFLASAITIALLLALPATLGMSCFVAVRLLLDVVIVRAGENLSELANKIGSSAWFFGLATVLAAFWFFPLFWANRQMRKNGFTRMQIFWAIAISSWVGLGLGRLVGLITIKG